MAKKIETMPLKIHFLDDCNRKIQFRVPIHSLVMMLLLHLPFQQQQFKNEEAPE